MRNNFKRVTKKRMKQKKRNSDENEDLSKKVFALGNQFIAVERLGKGTYGTVYKVKIKTSDKYYAIKKIKNEMDDEGIPSTALREIAILKKMKHPNVVNVEGIAFNNNNNIELCLEYCRYDLKKLIEHKKKDTSFYTEKFVKNMMYQLLKGVEHLHSHKILHRDLKPQNILVDDNGWILKLADFGLSRVYSIPIRPYTKEVLTLWYRAPEMSLGIGNYAIGLDIWSIGCIFAELYIGKPLFTGDSEIDQLFKIMQVFGTFNELTLPGYKAFPYFDPDFPYWKGCGLRYYINRRHSVLKMDDVAFDLLEKMLAIDPVKRITCKEALNHPYFDDVVCTCKY